MKPFIKCRHPVPERIETELGVVYHCWTCGQDITHWPRKLQNLYIKQRFYQGQGVSYTSWVMGIYNTIQTGGIIYLIFGGTKLGSLAIPIFILAWLLQMMVETWIGFKDYNKWKMAQRQNTLGVSFNPYQVEMMDKINEILLRVAPEYDKPSCLDKKL